MIGRCRGHFPSFRRPEQTSLLHHPSRWVSLPSTFVRDGSSVSFFESGDVETPAYRRHIQCHRPPMLRPRDLLPNNCSFIGKVSMPLRRSDSRYGSVGVYTVLEVKKAPWACDRRVFSPFRILIRMWNELAKVSLTHLKANDFVYVSGRLSSYEKVDDNGKKEIRHMVVVEDLNYVQCPGGVQTLENSHAVNEDAHACSSGNTAQEKEQRDRLRLWQEFFAYPHDWWDNRQQKPYKSCPDFRHKHTRECLCLGPDDPPWVKKQLERYDLERTRVKQKDWGSASSCISELL